MRTACPALRTVASWDSTSLFLLPARNSSARLHDKQIVKVEIPRSRHLIGPNRAYARPAAFPLMAEVAKRGATSPPKVEHVEVVPREVTSALAGAQDAVQGAMRALEKVRGRLDVASAIATKRPTPPPIGKATAPIPIARATARPIPTEDAPLLSKCARALLSVLAERGVTTDSRIAALSGYRKTSSGFANSLSELRTQGLIDGSKDRRTITATGRDVAGPTEPLPTGRALLDYWLPRLGKCEAAMLAAIFEAGTIARDDLSAATGYSLTSSGFANGLSGLRVLDLVHGPNGGDLTIADVFSEAA
jgi:hypothetical protein